MAKLSSVNKNNKRIKLSNKLFKKIYLLDNGILVLENKFSKKNFR